jgi:hypothetical protein
MPTKGEVRAYQATTAALADGAGEGFKEIIRAYLRANPDASVSELRDYAIKTAESVCAQYSVASAVVAEDMYESEVGSLPPGRYEPNVSHDAIDDAVRYHVGKAADGDVGGFLRSMGSWVSQATFNTCNQRTLDLASAGKSAAQRKRERRAAAKAAHEVFFARVPTGVNTCAWCAMLAGRGYVYWTAETAGAYSKWHAHCRCTVVASAKKGGIGGYDPTVWEALSREYEKIEASGLPDVQQKAVKLAYADSLGAYDGSQAELADAFQVAASSAWASFAKEKSLASYESTMSSLVKEMGAAYGATWSLESTVSSAGARVYARPNGDELWIAAKIGGSAHNLAFLAQDRDLAPDALVDGTFAEFKSPGSIRKITKRLAHAEEQLNSVGGGVTYLSLLHLDGHEAEAREISRGFVGAGETRTLAADGTIETLTRTDAGLGS